MGEANTPHAAGSTGPAASPGRDDVALASTNEIEPGSVYVIVDETHARVVLSGEIDADLSADPQQATEDVRESGLPHETNALFTNIEGEWDEVMAVLKRAVDVVAEVSPRVGLVLKADIRPGYDGQLTAKVERIEETLRGE